MNVYNTRGACVGIVDEVGGLYDANGTSQGSIDSQGFVWNRKNVFVGQVHRGTEVVKPGRVRPFAIISVASGAVFGYVDETGTIFQMHLGSRRPEEPPGREVGHVSPLTDFSLAGAAIWLLLEDKIFTLPTSASLRPVRLKELEQVAKPGGTTMDAESQALDPQAVLAVPPEAQRAQEAAVLRGGCLPLGAASQRPRVVRKCSTCRQNTQQRCSYCLLPICEAHGERVTPWFTTQRVLVCPPCQARLREIEQEEQALGLA
jgi:hypothetical protein